PSNLALTPRATEGVRDVVSELQAEYREELTRCKDCEVGLVDAIPEDQSLEQPEGEDLAKNEEDFSAGPASPSYVGRTLRALELLLVLFVSFGSKIVWALVHWQRGAVHFVFAEHYSVEGDVSGLLGYASSFGRAGLR